MGNCAVPSSKYGCVNGKLSTKYKIDKYDSEPNDTEQFIQHNTIKIPFSATFANVKVKKCPYVLFFVNSIEVYRHDNFN